MGFGRYINVGQRAVRPTGQSPCSQAPAWEYALKFIFILTTPTLPKYLEPIYSMVAYANHHLDYN